MKADRFSMKFPVSSTCPAPLLRPSYHHQLSGARDWRGRRYLSGFAGIILTGLAPCIVAQTPAATPDDRSPTATAPSLPRFGLAVSVSTLGAGIQAATAVTGRSNVRFGFNDFSYSTTLNRDGIAYKGTLSLRSVEILYDQYVRGPFHISPGVMIYDGNKGSANASAPSSQSFTLGGTAYYSQPGNPITGTGTIAGRKVAPMILIGFGNLLPRSAGHFTMNFDLGVVFQGSPSAALNLNGGACVGPTGGCLNASTDSTIHGNVLSEQNSINNSLVPFKYYPVVSLSFGYKF
jgi:hypothetical protein